MTMIITWLASAVMADYLLAGSRDLDPEPGVLAKADASNMGFRQPVMLYACDPSRNSRDTSATKPKNRNHAVTQPLALPTASFTGSGSCSC